MRPITDLSDFGDADALVEPDEDDVSCLSGPVIPRAPMRAARAAMLRSCCTVILHSRGGGFEQREETRRRIAELRSMLDAVKEAMHGRPTMH
jgi:hypothetical protein